MLHDWLNRTGGGYNEEGHMSTYICLGSEKSDQAPVISARISSIQLSCAKFRETLTQTGSNILIRLLPPSFWSQPHRITLETLDLGREGFALSIHRLVVS